MVAEERNSSIIVYFYDENGSPFGYQYRAADYEYGEWDFFAYEKNIFGDIVAVYDENGTKLVSYVYDAWGKCKTTTHATSATAAVNNPYRYRGYYYDFDLGMYYLQTRYYDAEICRFISSDYPDVLFTTPMALTDKNLYAYCDNNPVMRSDYGGDFWHIVIGATVGAIIGGAVKFASNLVEGKSATDGLATAMLAGAASGALATTGVGIVGIVAGNAAISMAENVANQVVENKGFNNFDVADMLIDAAIGGVSGALGGPGKGTKHLTNLGKQTVKRTFNTTTNKGIKAGLKEAGKAFAYYGKNTTKYYKEFRFGIGGDVLVSIGTAIASSSYMKYQYSRIFGR